LVTLGDTLSAARLPKTFPVIAETDPLGSMS